jgi:hypothetical protein
MLVRRFTVIILLLFVTSACSRAQRLDAAFTGGLSKVSDSTVIFTVGCIVPPASCPPPAFRDQLQTDNHYFLGGSFGLRLLNAKAFSLHLEVPVAGVMSQNLVLPSTPTFVSQMSAIFVTPSLQLRAFPDFPLTPWISAGGGIAHYSADPDLTTNKGALQFGGGVDFKVGLRHMRLRGEIRDFVTGDPNMGLVSGPFTGATQGGLHRHNVMVGGGVVFHF